MIGLLHFEGRGKHFLDTVGAEADQVFRRFLVNNRPEIAKDLVASSHKRMNENAVIRRPTTRVIAGLRSKVLDALNEALAPLDQENKDSAEKVRAMKHDPALNADPDQGVRCR